MPRETAIVGALPAALCGASAQRSARRSLAPERESHQNCTATRPKYQSPAASVTTVNMPNGSTT
jgi:hypothetical protein